MSGFLFAFYFYLYYLCDLRGGAVVACQAHYLKVVGSSPTPAPKNVQTDQSECISLGSVL